MSTDIFDQLQEKHFNPCIKDLGTGILDSHCGCMLSKWVSLEFKKIFTVEKDYMQLTIVYMEPFTDFDFSTLCIEWENVPTNIMHIYNVAKDRTTFRESDDIVDMIVPYIKNTRHTLLKRYNKHILNDGEMATIHGLYITTRKDLQRLNRIFKTL